MQHYNNYYLYAYSIPNKIQLLYMLELWHIYIYIYVYICQSFNTIIVIPNVVCTHQPMYIIKSSTYTPLSLLLSNGISDYRSSILHCYFWHTLIFHIILAIGDCDSTNLHNSCSLDCTANKSTWTV